MNYKKRNNNNTYRITATELRSIIREALLVEKIGGEKIKGWKPPWEGGGGGYGSGSARDGGYGGMDMEDMMYGLGGYEREISGERGASYGRDDGAEDPFDDMDDDDGDDDGDGDD